MNNNKSIIVLNQLAFTVFASIAVFTPFVAFQRIVFLGGAFLFWLMTALSIEKRWFRSSYKYFYVILLWAVMFNFVHDDRIINSSQSYFQRFYSFSLWTYIWCVVYMFYRNHLKIAILPLKVILVMFFVSCLFTIRGNIIYPEASRLLAGAIGDDTEFANVLKSLYIGGYGFIYGVIFLVMPTYLCFKDSVITNRKVMLLFLLVLVATTLMGAFFTGLFLMASMMVLCLSNPKNLWKFLLGIGVAGILFTIFFEQIMMFIIDIGHAVGSDTFARRAEQMLYGTYQSDYDAKNDLSRIERLYNASKNIMNSPFIGQLSSVHRRMYESGHSEFMGYFEKFGALGLTYVWFFKSFYEQCSRNLMNTGVRRYYFLYFIVVILFLFIDTFDIAYATGCVVFTIAPLMFQILDQRTSNKNIVA